ncbi:MAG TPA: CoA-binding protein [Actinomycetota bacterium]|nr:CoA-binding protein [Actinomycetota bacterium]
MRTPRQIVEQSRTIAVVGLSTDPSKAAHAVPASLQAAGYKLIPVNPNADTVLGEKAYRSLSEITEPVDVVQVFRPAEEAPDIARAAVKIGAKALWLQLGIGSDEARGIAEAGGLDFVENRCMGVERARHDITPPPAS